ncbi:MAG TPA: BTAD domain-containing putative transcriptional regulator [Candidatus Limnocylindrales bacterium]
MATDRATIRVLGPVELASRRLTPLERAALAMLAASHGHTVTVQRLTDGLWPERPPEWARNRIHSLVSSLRRSLPAGTLATVYGGYQLHADESILDILVFERSVRHARRLRESGDEAGAARVLGAALELWRGKAFEDVPAEVVAAAEAARLTELRDRALEDLYELRLGGGEDVVAELARLVDAAPLRPRPRGLLMQALHRAGRQAEALQVYRAGARLLAGEHGLDPAPQLRRLHDAILRDEEAQWLAVGTPRQIPAAPPDFTGRDKELRTLRAVVMEAAEAPRPGSSLVVAISGMAGVGKTTLAVRVAHDVAAQFPGGCLYADLRGTDVPAPTMQVLGSFLRACGVSGESLPSTLEDRSALYRTVLAERKVLVLLDNVAGEEQVRPLLPGAGGTALLTSRRTLTGLAGARLVRLDVFAPQDTVDLLAAIAGRDRVAREPDAAQRIAALCGGLPLAIRVAAVRLAAHDNLSLDALSERLSDERERLDELALGDIDVRASLAVSRRQLSDEQALLWRALCLLPLEEFPVWLVALMLDIPPGRAHRRLEELAGAQLLAPGEGDRYRMHDLIRLLGREPPGDEPLGLAMLACHRMLEVVRAANAALPCRPIPVPPPRQRFEQPDPVGFLGAELGNVMAAVRFALDRGEAELAAELAVAMVNFLMLRGHTDEWEQSHSLVLRRGELLPPATLARVELGMGTLQRFRDRNRESLGHLRRAWALMRGVGDVVGEATTALSWSVAVRLLGRVGPARTALAHSLALVPPTSDEPLRSGYTLHSGYTLMARYHLEPDLDLLQRALAIFEGAGEAWGAAEAHTMLAGWHFSSDDLDTSAAHTRRAMELYGRFGDRVNFTAAQFGLVKIYLARSQHDQAASLLHSALRTARDIHHPWCQATAHRHLGQLMLDKDDAARALEHLEAASEIMRAAGQLSYLGLSLELQAKAHARLGHHDLARRTGQEAYEILARVNPRSAPAVAAWLSTLDKDSG